MAKAIVPRITAKGKMGGKPIPGSPWAAAAEAALDELLVIALSVNHGLADVAAAACWAVG